MALTRTCELAEPLRPRSFSARRHYPRCGGLSLLQGQVAVDQNHEPNRLTNGSCPLLMGDSQEMNFV